MVIAALTLYYSIFMHFLTKWFISAIMPMIFKSPAIKRGCSGFDGVYLDIVDGYEFFEQRAGKEFAVNPATGAEYCTRPFAEFEFLADSQTLTAVSVSRRGNTVTLA